MTITCLVPLCDKVLVERTKKEKPSTGEIPVKKTTPLVDTKLKGWGSLER